MPSITFPSGSILAPTVLDLSSNVSSIYSTVCANSASWAEGGGSDVSGLSANWQNTYATVTGNSANWNNSYTTINAYSGNWSNNSSVVNSNSATWGSITTLSSSWQNTYATVSGTSGRWESAYSTLNDVSASFGDSLTWVKNNSSTMYVDKLGINTNINLLPSNLRLAVQGDTVIYGNLSSLGSTTLVNLTTNTTDALSVVNPGLGSPNAIYVEQNGGSGAVIRVQNNAAGPLMVLSGNGNVGIGTGTPNAKLTVVGTISANNIIYASGGNSDQWNTAVGSSTTFGTYSGGWQSNYGTTNSLSSNWNNGYSALTANSGRWTNAYNTVTGNSASWSNAYNTLTSNSASWGNSYNTLTSNSASWNSTYTTTSSYSGLWNTAAINYVIDGGGGAIVAGSKGVIYMPSKFIVTNWRVFANTDATLLRIDIRRFPNGTFKLNSLSSDSLLIDKVNPNIVNELTLIETSSAIGNNGNIFAGISANDTIEFYISEIQGEVGRITVAIGGIKSV
jgi:hypothetical protein